MQQIRAWIARDPNTAVVVMLVAGLVVGGFVGFAAASGGDGNVEEDLSRMEANLEAAHAEAEEYREERDQANDARDEAIAEAEMWHAQAQQAIQGGGPGPSAESEPTPEPKPKPKPQPEPEPEPATIVEQEVVNEDSPLEAVRVSLLAPDDPRGAARDCGEGIDNPSGGVCWAFPSREAFQTDSTCWRFMASRDEPGGSVNVSRQSDAILDLANCP